MNYLLILSLAIFLVAAESLDSAHPFTSVRVNLALPTIKRIAKKNVATLVSKLKDAKLGPFRNESVIIGLKFSMVTDEFNIINVNDALTIVKEEYNNGIFNGVYENVLELNATFHSKVTVSGALVDDSKGDLTLMLKSFSLTQDYSKSIPTTVIKVEHEITSLNYDGGVFYKFVADAIRQQVNKAIELLLNFSIEDLQKADPLGGIDTPYQVVEVVGDNAIKITTERILEVDIVPKENFQQRFVRAKASYNGGEMVNLTTECDIERPETNTSSEICFCPYMFPQMLFMSSKETPVELSNWNLKGKVIELYEVLPNLVNYYSPDVDYTVTVKLTNAINDGFGSNPELEKRYNFKIGDEIVLELTTIFTLELAGNVIKDGTKAEFFADYKSANVKEVKTNILVQPSGRTVLARFMLSEIEQMENHHMFGGGVPLPEGTSSVSAIDTESFCVKFDQEQTANQ